MRQVTFRRPRDVVPSRVDRPEKKPDAPGPVRDFLHDLSGIVLRPWLSGRVTKRRVLGNVARGAEGLEALTDAQLQERARGLRVQLQQEGFTDTAVGRAFALVRETARRTLSLRHHDVQLVGGWVMLEGMVAEMETGEGKTLTATLPAATAALAGVPVHVITVNDYLAARDAASMRPVYEFLGLTVGCVIGSTPRHERRVAYDRDVTYATNKDIAFDYLRDTLILGEKTHPLRLHAERIAEIRPRMDQMLLRGLHFAIVDEADSVLVDESRTPLIISGKKGEGKKGRDEELEFYQQALELAKELEEKRDFSLESSPRRARLSPEGVERIRLRARELGPLWAGAVRRNDTVCKALQALHLLKKEEQYLVKDKRVLIVDEFTGRVMPRRAWERGLHQLVEVKEGLKALSRDGETLARISYQRFFRRYLHLAGMTGTAREVAAELWSVYGLPVVSLPTHRPLRRQALPDRFFPDPDSKWAAIVERVKELTASGRPVLIGTRSIRTSEWASAQLKEAGLEHRVLNAKQDKEEAEIIAQAGQAGAITIATNMAGRGTDILLGEGVAEKGGLHVILTERHEAGRIDRQLAGRTARQGDPGTHEAILSLKDPLLEDTGGLVPSLISRLTPGSMAWERMARWLMRLAQRRLERVHARMRRDLLKHDERQRRKLSFAGRSE